MCVHGMFSLYMCSLCICVLYIYVCSPHPQGTRLICALYMCVFSISKVHALIVHYLRNEVYMECVLCVECVVSPRYTP